MSFFVLGLFFLFDGLLVAVAAKRLVLMGLTQQHPLVVFHSAVTDVGQVAALDADGVYLGDIVGNGAEGWHGTEGDSLEVHVEAGNDDADTTIGQFVADVDQPHVEELRLVDAHHVDIG